MAQDEEQTPPPNEPDEAREDPERDEADDAPRGVSGQLPEEAPAEQIPDGARSEEGDAEDDAETDAG